MLACVYLVLPSFQGDHGMTRGTIGEFEAGGKTTAAITAKRRIEGRGRTREKKSDEGEEKEKKRNASRRTNVDAAEAADKRWAQKGRRDEKWRRGGGGGGGMRRRRRRRQGFSGSCWLPQFQQVQSTNQSKCALLDGTGFYTAVRAPSFFLVYCWVCPASLAAISLLEPSFTAKETVLQRSASRCECALLRFLVYLGSTVFVSFGFQLSDHRPIEMHSFFSSQGFLVSTKLGRFFYHNVCFFSSEILRFVSKVWSRPVHQAVPSSEHRSTWCASSNEFSSPLPRVDRVIWSHRLRLLVTKRRSKVLSATGTRRYPILATWRKFDWFYWTLRDFSWPSPSWTLFCRVPSSSGSTASVQQRHWGRKIFCLSCDLPRSSSLMVERKRWCHLKPALY